MKLRQGFKLYAIVTQYLMQTVALVVFGVYFGSKLDLKYGTENVWSGALGILGIFIGLISFAFFVYKQGGKNGK